MADSVQLGEFKRVPLISPGYVNSEWMGRFRDFLKSIETGTDPKRFNYTEKKLDLPGHLAFDLLVNSKEEIVTFCGIFNGGRYPKGVFRVINRVYVAPQYRVAHGRFPFLASNYLFPVQMHEWGSRIKLAFISREHPKSRNYLKKWVRQFAPEPGWQVTDDMVNVTRWGFTQNCYQVMASKMYEPVEWNPKRVSIEDWHQLPITES